MTATPLWLIALALAWLAGCSDGATPAAPPRAETAPAPAGAAPRAFTEPAPFAYSGGTLRDPFQPPPSPRGEEEAAQRQPAEQRGKHPLEAFPIEGLRMAGTLSRHGTAIALVRDGNGLVHQVSAGDYLGKDSGRVHTVNEAGVELVEHLSDGAGGQVRRPRRLTFAAPDPQEAQ